MRKGKMVAQACHASMKVLLDAAWPADQIRTTGLSPRVEALGAQPSSGGVLSGVYRCIPLGPDVRPWVEGKFTKVCVGIDSEAGLIEIHEKAKAAGLLTAIILDAGLTEFNGVPTLTCCAIGPGKIEEIDKITGTLKLL